MIYQNTHGEPGFGISMYLLRRSSRRPYFSNGGSGRREYEKVTIDELLTPEQLELAESLAEIFRQKVGKRVLDDLDAQLAAGEITREEYMETFNRLME